ncbi:hypothetical protein ABIE18_002405 [Arthrobacter sp. 2762]
MADDLEASPPLQRRRYWDTILAALLTTADTRGEVDSSISVDSTVNRAHQHFPRHTGPTRIT